MLSNFSLFTNPRELSQEQDRIVSKALEYKEAALSKNTHRAYGSMYRKFCRWCQKHNLSPLPATAETIALFLSDIAEDASFSTVDSAIAAIERAHKEARVEIEGDRDIYKSIRRGIRRSHPNKLQQRRAPALSLEDLRAELNKLGSSPQDLRDRALVLLGYFGAFRRSELVSIKYCNISFEQEGLIIYLLGGKTTDKLQEVHISKTKDRALCPVLALKLWLAKSGITEGAPVFQSLLKNGKPSGKQLSGHSVSHVMKRVFGADYSGHSLRRGIITQAARAGTQVHEIRKLSRHRSADMVLRYSESARGFETTSAKALGL